MNKIKVLVVDDSAVVRQVVSEVLARDPSIEVMGAVADPIFAMERMHKAWPDVIVLDVEMPRMDGYQLVRCLRGDARTSDTPLIILSAMTREEDQTIGMLSGVDEYLKKPFKPAELNAAIERVLRLTPTDRQRRMDYLVQTQADRE